MGVPDPFEPPSSVPVPTRNWADLAVLTALVVMAGVANDAIRTWADGPATWGGTVLAAGFLLTRLRPVPVATVWHALTSGLVFASYTAVNYVMSWSLQGSPLRTDTPSGVTLAALSGAVVLSGLGAGLMAWIGVRLGIGWGGGAAGDTLHDELLE